MFICTVCNKSYKYKGCFDKHQDLCARNTLIRNKQRNDTKINYAKNVNCSFFTNFTNFSMKNNNNFIISLININSIQNKFQDISFILEKRLVDILVIQETKLNPLNDDRLFENPSYNMIRRDRESDKGGGILVYIRKIINISNVDTSPTLIMR